VGKSTFLQILSGKLAPTTGSIVTGANAHIGYYAQTGLNISADQEKSTLLRFVLEAVQKSDPSQGNAGSGRSAWKDDVGLKVLTSEAGHGGSGSGSGSGGSRLDAAGVSVTVALAGTGASGGTAASSVAYSEREAMSLLKRFQFPAGRWHDRVDRLSGGERRRLQLLQVLAARPNILLLDEPSNDLGIVSFLFFCFLLFCFVFPDGILILPHTIRIELYRTILFAYLFSRVFSTIGTTHRGANRPTDEPTNGCTDGRTRRPEHAIRAGRLPGGGVRGLSGGGLAR
jgi:ATPase subunit of ABC transporter with duplicated ATPase domains